MNARGVNSVFVAAERIELYFFQFTYYIEGVMFVRNFKAIYVCAVNRVILTRRCCLFEISARYYFYKLIFS